VYEPEDEELQEFVRQSNAIEGIYAGPGDPLYDDHLRAARMVALDPKDFVPLSRLLHHTIMRSQPDAFPGDYRRVNVRVGHFVKPPHSVVPDLMRDLDLRVKHRIDAGGVFTYEECWNLHHEFEHVHPFVDGNGRTGRLWLNTLLLASGHEWETVFERNRQAYYDKIRTWESERGLL